MLSPTVRRTLIGALVGGGIFFLASLYQSVKAGGGLLRFAAPTAALVLIGATVGGLLGPLLGRIGSRGARDGGGGGKGGRAARRDARSERDVQEEESS